MRINYNVSAMVANNSLFQSDTALSKSLEKLSSGININHAKDNPAGLAMAKRMNAQVVGLSVASENASTGVNIVETADGAMTEIHDMLQRMNELAVKASTGTTTEDDREVIDLEVQQLLEEIQRISEDTQFNGQPLLDGTFDLKGYTSDETIKISSYSTDVEAGMYTFDSIAITEVDGVNVVDPANGITFGEGFPADAKVVSSIDGIVTIEASGDFQMKIDIRDAAPGMVTGLEVDATGIGAMRLQVGANEGQIIGMVIPDISIDKLGMKELNVKTLESAQEANGLIKNALTMISDVRASIGAYQNRLESTVDTIGVSSENMTSAYSRIMDVDMAKEMTNYTTYQVLTQAGTAMLAQANERPSSVLQLLQ